MTLFYRIMLFLTQLELEAAKAAPVRNSENIKRLSADEAAYSHALLMRRLNCG